MDKAQLFAFIDGQKLGVLSSVNAQGKPESALVGIAVTPQLEIVFDTVKTSRKYANLIGNPAAALVVGWTGEQTLQYEGTAAEPAKSELERYKAFYFARFPDGPARESWPGICYFVLKPAWIRYSDYHQTPALMEEFTF